MKQKGSIAQTVFDSLYATIAATEDIHRNIAGTRDETMKRDRRYNANVYETIRSVSGKVEGIVMGFFK